jgi:striatin 1/3/4
MEKIEDSALGQQANNTNNNSSFPGGTGLSTVNQTTSGNYVSTGTNVNAESSSVINNQRSAYTIPGVLHFLQHEWTRFEYDRQQWEADRAELTVSRTLYVLLQKEI